MFLKRNNIAYKVVTLNKKEPQQNYFCCGSFINAETKWYVHIDIDQTHSIHRQKYECRIDS